MFNYNLATPCPAAVKNGREVAFESKQKQSIFDDTFDQFNDNTTQNIARLVQHEFKNAPPRRTQNLTQKPRRKHAPISVFEDGGGQQEPCRRDEPARTMASSTINARPALKIRMEASRNDKSIASLTESSDIAATKPIDTKHAREDRRRTIWIPSDDTTLLSIHPGAYDHTLCDETIGLPANDLRALRKTPRPTPLGASAMRQAQRMAPTSTQRPALKTLPPSQANLSRNIMGSGGGKENLPPGSLLSKHDKGEKPAVKPASKALPLAAKQTQSFMQQTSATQARSTNIRKRPASELKDAPKSKIQARAPAGRMTVTDTASPRDASSISVIKEPRLKASAISKDIAKPVIANPISNAPKDFDLPNPRSTLSASRYPVLTDDLGQPELYEDSWLQHQEIALTQLVNVVFQQAHHSPSLDGVNALRSRLLTLYHDASIATLHKRLKASLLFGALSMPKKAPNFPKLRDDIGLRRQFLDLFMNTYNLDVLQAAAETVIGRVATVNNGLSEVAQSKDSGAVSTSTKELRRFLLTFLIHHEDSAELSDAHKVKFAEEAALQPGTAEWFWQRTVLRTLMIIYLLDQAKTAGELSTCLFQTSSLHKSSASVLQAIARFLTPSVGDISRPLGHLSYSLHHIQQPLSEYVYRIDNLAIDLRNGVLLTRFVELLLYPSSTLDAQSDRTVTLDLPDGETLTSFLDVNRTDHVLSQHLKFPCIGRAQKTHNVQVALSALAGVRGLMGTATENIKAEDIVNGHREKTLSLLWALVSKWGLGFLVDWNELRKETRRFSKDATQSSDTSSDDQPDTLEQGNLLKNWAANICHARKIPITNLTTSFADGRALSAIISTYATHVPPNPKQKTSSRTSTADGLRSLGCSESFIALFASHATTIPSRSSTIALLAFLASRLLPLARTHRAACSIQRSYRLRLSRRAVSSRVQKLKAGAQCAAVAKEKQRRVDAAVTLQRCWRKVLDRRIEGLERDVLVFQALARGWAVRRATAGVLSGGVGGGRRVMGGW